MYNERKEYYDKITRGASHTELIRWVWWGFFSKKKFEKMSDYLEVGMTFKYAMHRVKNDL
jgi:hypothetical protein|tara:strand:+ start:66 stop:245 length:180 start_codon:yes stop_codon:yes gene_type:complete